MRKLCQNCDHILINHVWLSKMNCWDKDRVPNFKATMSACWMNSFISIFHMWNLSQFVVHWGLTLTAPVLITAQKRKVAHLVFGIFVFVVLFTQKPSTLGPNGPQIGWDFKREPEQIYFRGNFWHQFKLLNAKSWWRCLYVFIINRVYCMQGFILNINN